MESEEAPAEAEGEEANSTEAEDEGQRAIEELAERADKILIEDKFLRESRRERERASFCSRACNSYLHDNNPSRGERSGRKKRSCNS